MLALIAAARRSLRMLGRSVTILVVPHADLPMLRARFSFAFGLFCLGLWTGITLWAGYLAGGRTDYWVTKLDNKRLRERVRFMVDEISEARQVVTRARETDRQMRELLRLPSRDHIIRAEAVGGPSPEELEASVRPDDPDGVEPGAVQLQLASVRRESERRLASFQEISWYIKNQQDLYRATPTGWPADGRITSTFGHRFSPFGRREESFGEYHPGIDIASDAEVAPILATADGTVRKAGWWGGFGQMVQLDHGHGYETLFGHLSKIAVRDGERVRRGDVIAYMGTTGRSTGTHLHYEVRRNGKPVNPYLFLGPRPDPEAMVARRER